MIPISDSVKTGKLPLFNLFIIGLNIYIFIRMILSPNVDTFILHYSLIPQVINFSNVDTLVSFVTSMFLHAGFLHIASNMLFLWVFGDNIEAHFGKLWYLMIYFLSGIAGSLVQYSLDPHSAIPVLGASGAISGILGAYFVSHPHAKIKTLLFIFFFVTVVQVPAFIYILYWFGLQLLSGIIQLGTVAKDAGGVAFWAHVGGFITGVLLAKVGNKEYHEEYIEGEFEEI